MNQESSAESFLEQGWRCLHVPFGRYVFENKVFFCISLNLEDFLFSFSLEIVDFFFNSEYQVKPYKQSMLGCDGACSS